MKDHSISEELNRIADDDFAARSGELVDEWIKDDVGLEAVMQILHFMESHPSIDYGMPGGLVHFMERFYREGYEQRLLESVERAPTFHTVWMLNRLINGARSDKEKRTLLTALEGVLVNPRTDAKTLHRAKHFLEVQGGGP
jgi:hypothetical protein